MTAGGCVPRVGWHADYHVSSGGDAVTLAAECGLTLDDWQSRILEHGLGERRDGLWQHRSVGVCVPRQNGKGVVITARELAGLFLLGEELIIHTAHKFKTALDGMRRLEQALKSSPDTWGRVKRVSRSNGDEVIELESGQRVMFMTRTPGGARGLSCDCLILDEAMDLSDTDVAALLPTLSARPNPQVWYLGSAVDQSKQLDGHVFARIRRNGVAGGHENVAWFEWALDYGSPGDVPVEVASDPAAWAAVNPAYGLPGRIGEDDVRGELTDMSPRSFAVERLGVGDWPAEDAASGSVITWNVWRGLVDGSSVLPDPVFLGVDVSPDLKWSSIVAAGVNSFGVVHVEVWEHRPGVRWVKGRLRELVSHHQVGGLIVDGKGQASAQVRDAVDGVNVTVTDYRMMVEACAEFATLAHEGELVHLGDDILGDAVRGAGTRSLGGAWAWSRGSDVDITALVAATLAGWAASQAAGRSVYEDREMLVLG